MERLIFADENDSAELKDGYLTVSAKANEEHEEKDDPSFDEIRAVMGFF